MATQAQRAQQLMANPWEFFGGSVTKMHSIPREELEPLQKIAMSLRFAEQYQKIEILRKHADSQGIKAISEFEDVVPLLFAHTAFKSYPASILEKKRYDLLAQWLAKQTSYDMSKADMRGCDSIDEFLARLDQQTELLVITSSGTTGTLSLIPRSRAYSELGMQILKGMLFQRFGTEPTEADWNLKVDIVWPRHEIGTIGMLRALPATKKVFSHNDESAFHPLHRWGIPAEVLLLASRIRLAKAKGELDRLQIDPKLLARKAELEARQAKGAEETDEYLKRLAVQVKGKRVYMTIPLAQAYQFAARGLELGIKGIFHPDSGIVIGGGKKGHVLPDNYWDIIKEFMGVNRINKLYGFSEAGSSHLLCEHGNYHVQPYSVPLLLDPNTSELLPRQGVQTGRMAFYELTNDAHWGGVISGDEVTIHWDADCPCGRKTVYIEDNIIRYSEKNGGDDDRIMCSATQSFADEAIDFMKTYEL